jgi:FkbM family methyltransferase
MNPVSSGSYAARGSGRRSKHRPVYDPGRAVRVADGRVLAFEPHPGPRARLQQLLALNGLSDLVTVSGAALSDRSAAAAPLFVTSDSGSVDAGPFRRPVRRRVRVPLERRRAGCRAWDDSLSAAGPPWDSSPIDVVKTDVEGTGGAGPPRDERTLARSPSLRIVCETTAGSTADRLLKAAGFTGRPLESRRAGFGNYLYLRD